MKLKVRVIPNAKKIRVKLSGDSARIYLTAQAKEGAANKQLKKVLADCLKIKKRTIHIASGQKSRDKIVEINK
ncbi:MAG: DUF167 domain-containing protein [Candidatus Omnitrophica bacterium]|nr:DUF167 domain-containing protein [Candidatus Omnitrophota bacterium]MCF7876932.1 DUF167 domain-containing protein [Candidatus Omnitrophota bacterium]MCF7878612.1 DUF167 domain-containing protein [Candidatus Omnitrophota bacterium]MCF7893067.1 DUF167 domain-containing protein [Candidatus Omnitrophota bacterium]